MPVPPVIRRVPAVVLAALVAALAISAIALARSGGDETYGFVDSHGDGAVVYKWIDVSASGTRMATVSQCDDCAEEITLPFAVTAYDTSSTLVSVVSNGAVLVGGGYDAPGSRIDLPSSIGPGFLPFSTDLDPSSQSLAGGIYFDVVGSSPDRIAVVQWQDVVPKGTSDPLTFQVQFLESTGDVFFQYQDVVSSENWTPSADIGINAEDGSRAAVYADDSDAMDDTVVGEDGAGGDGTAIHFFRVDGVDDGDTGHGLPGAFIVPAMTSSTVTLTWQDTAPAGGDYQLLRDGTTLTTLPAGTVEWQDTAPTAGVQHDYQLVVRDGTGAPVATHEVRASVPGAGCTIAWTGAYNDEWGHDQNWARVQDTTPAALRLPDSTDEVCLDTNASLPIWLDGGLVTDPTVASIATTLPDGTHLDVSETTLTVTGTTDLGYVELFGPGGSLDLGDATIARLITGDQATLTSRGDVDIVELDPRNDLTIVGPGVVGVTDPLVIDSGHLTLDGLTVSASDMTVASGRSVVGDGATLLVSRLTVPEDATSVTWTQIGATPSQVFVTQTLDAQFRSVADIGWMVNTGPTATVTLANLASLTFSGGSADITTTDGRTTLADAPISLGFDAVLTIHDTPIDVLATDVTFSDTGAALLDAAGQPLLGALDRLESTLVLGADQALTVEGGLDIAGVLRMAASTAELTVPGTVTFDPPATPPAGEPVAPLDLQAGTLRLGSAGEGTLVVPDVSPLPLAIQTPLTGGGVTAGPTIDGSLQFDGPALIGHLTVTGDLTVGTAGDLTVNVVGLDASNHSTLAVGGTTTLGGTLTVVTRDIFSLADEIELIDDTTTTGTEAFDTVVVAGDPSASDPSLTWLVESRAGDGIYLVVGRDTLAFADGDVLGVDLGDAETLTLRWPSVDGVDHYRVRETATGSAMTLDTQVASGAQELLVEGLEPGVTHTFTVAPVDAESTEGAALSTSLRTPVTTSVCGINWLGGTSSAWDDAANWRDTAGAARVPTGDDVVCIATDADLPVTLPARDVAAQEILVAAQNGVLTGPDGVTLTTDRLAIGNHAALVDTAGTPTLVATEILVTGEGTDALGQWPTAAGTTDLHPATTWRPAAQTLGAADTVRIRFDGASGAVVHGLLAPGAPQTLDGTLDLVRGTAAIGNGDAFDVVTGSLSGVFAAVTGNEAVDGIELQVTTDATAVTVTGATAAVGCAADPVVTRPDGTVVTLSGCFTDNGDGTLSTTDPVQIGGLELVPSGTLTLDTATGQLTSSEQVAVGTVDGDTAAQSLGTQSTLSWDLTTASIALTLDTTDVLGAPVGTAATLTFPANETVTVTVPVVLPPFLGGGEIDVPLVTTAAGIDATAVRGTGSGIAGELWALDSLTVALGDGSWDVTATGPDGQGAVTGTLTWDAGDVAGGSLTLEDLPLLGLRPFGIRVDFDPATDDWADPLDSVTFDYDAGGVLGPARVALPDVLVGELFSAVDVAIVRDGPGAWTFEGTNLGGSLTVEAGRPVAASLTFEQVTLGNVVTITDVAWTWVQDLLTETWTIDSGTVQLPGVDGSLAGDVTLTNLGELVAAELRIDRLTIGELGRLDTLVATHTSDGTWTLAAGWVCDGNDPTTATGSLTFSDGSLTAGSVDLVEVCLGPVTVDVLGLSYAGSDAATDTFAVTGRMTVPEVDGQVGVSGSIAVAGGGLDVGSLLVDRLPMGDLIVLEDVQLALSEIPWPPDAPTTTADHWSLDTSVTAPTVLGDSSGPVSVGLTFHSGSLVGGRVAVDRTAFGGWLVIDGLELAFDPAGWNVAGTLTAGAGGGTVDGVLSLDHGEVTSGSFSLNELAIGETVRFTQFDATYDGDHRWEISGVPAGHPGGGPNDDLCGTAAGAGVDRPLCGVLVYAHGSLVEARVELDVLPVGDWLQLGNVAFAYDTTNDDTSVAETARWDLTGTLDSGWSPTAVTGLARFTGGDLRAGELVLTDVPIGPSTIEELYLSYDATYDAGPLVVEADTWQVRGLVAGPDYDTTGQSGQTVDERYALQHSGEPPSEAPDAAGLEAAGHLVLQDSSIVEGEFAISFLEVAGAYHIAGSDLKLGFTRDQTVGGDPALGATRISAVLGSGRGLSRDGTSRAADAASIDVAYRDGELLGARLQVGAPDSGGGVSLGGLLFVENFTLATGDGVHAGEAVDNLDDRWYASGAFGPGRTTVSGSLALEDRQILDGYLELGDAHLGSLAVVNDLRVEFGEILPDLGGGTTTDGDDIPTVPGGARFMVTGSFTHDEAEPPVDFTGRLALRDGGLESAAFALAELPFGEVATLEELTLDYLASDVTTWALGASLRDGDGTESHAVGGSGTWVAGSLAEGRLTLSNLDLGPVELASLTVCTSVSGNCPVGSGIDPAAHELWTVNGMLAQPAGADTAFDGWLRLRQGGILDGSLRLDDVSIGEVVELRTVEFGVARKGDAEEWDGAVTATSYPAPDGSGPEEQALSTVQGSFDLTFVDDALVAATIDVPRVRWKDLFRVDDLLVEYREGQTDEPPGVHWFATGSLEVPSAASGQLTAWIDLDDGAATAGEILLNDLEVADLATVRELRLSYDDSGVGTRWSGDGTLLSGDGTTTSLEGAFEWRRGEIESARIVADGAGLSDTIGMQQLQFCTSDDAAFCGLGEIDLGDTWVVGGTTDEGGAVEGTATFADSRLIAATIGMDGLDFGPFVLDETTLTVTSPSANSATTFIMTSIVERGARRTQLDGRLDLDGGRILGGGLEMATLTDPLSVGNLVDLTRLALGYEDLGDGDRWHGGATAVDEDGEETGGSLLVEFDGDGVHRVDLRVERIELGETIEIHDLCVVLNPQVPCQPDGGPQGIPAVSPTEAWAVAGNIITDPDRAPAPFGGSLALRDGTILSGQLYAAEVSIEEVFRLDDVDLVYAADDPVAGSVLELRNATVVYGQDRGDQTTISGSGSVSFKDGDLTGFSVGVESVPLLDAIDLCDLTVSYGASGWGLGGGVAMDDDCLDTAYFAGLLDFDEGELLGGSLVLDELPLGIFTLYDATIDLGVRPTGTTARTWGLSGAIEDAGDPDRTANTAEGETEEEAAVRTVTHTDETKRFAGSVTVDAGEVVSGSLTVPEGMDIAGLFTMPELSFAMTDVPAGTRYVASVSERGGRDGTVDLTFSDGEVVAGDVRLSNLSIAEVLDVGRLEIAGTDDRWSGEVAFEVDMAGATSTVAIDSAFAFERGRLTSGRIAAGGEIPPTTTDCPEGASAASLGLGPLPITAFILEYGTLVDETWDLFVAAELPVPSRVQLCGSLQIVDRTLGGASLTAKQLNIPVSPGLMLNTLGLGYQHVPFEMAGTVGLSVDGGATSAADITGTVLFKEDPNGYLLRADGDVVVLPDLPVASGPTLQGSLEYHTAGRVGFEAGVELALSDYLAVNGGLGGFLDATGAFVDPVTGQVVDPAWSATVEAALTVAGFEAVRANVVADSIGLSGCAGIDLWIEEYDAGFGVRWDAPDDFHLGGCDLGNYQLAPRFDGGAAAGDGGSSTTWSVEIPAGTTEHAVRVRGDGGQPDVELVDPNGTRYGVGVDETKPVAGLTYGDDVVFLMYEPIAGTWTVEPTATRTTSSTGGRSAFASASAPVLEVASASELPPVSVTAEVMAGPGLGYEIGVIDGQTVTFIEELPAGGGGVIATVSDASGTIPFSPVGAEATERHVVAEVRQDGRLRDRFVVATYTPEAGSVPGAPSGVAATEIDGGVRVTWTPPTDAGGRAISAYELRSTAGGFTTVADASATSADVWIPGLEPGETHTLFLWARNAAGLGDPVAIELTATQATGGSLAPADDWDPHPVSGGGGGSGVAPGTDDGPPNVRGLDLACPDGTPRSQFPDVDSDGVHGLAVDCLAWWELLAGQADGTFGPDRPLRRDQLASVLARGLDRLGVELPTSPPDAFGDDDGNVHESAINRLAEAGIVNGRSPTTYAPATTVTRAQLASLMVRVYELVTGDTAPEGGDWFTDDDSSVHEAAIASAGELGLVAGYDAVSFGPGDPVRRDQVATFLGRLLDLFVELGHGEPPG